MRRCPGPYMYGPAGQHMCWPEQHTCLAIAPIAIIAPYGDAEATPYTGRTAWARNLAAPVRDFLSTETGSAIVLLAAVLAALLWANSPWSHSYESLWTTKLSIHDRRAAGSRPTCATG